MLQRIQTVYLLLIVILSCITFYLPTVDLINIKSALHYIIDFKGVYLVQEKGNVWDSTVWGLTSVAAVIPFIAFYTILQYKNRVKQIRLSVINMLLMLGYYVVLFINIWFISGRLNAEWHLRFVTVLPLVCMVLNYLAIGSIGKDEALVKSTDRIR
jgi:hypothetical protein